jgi:hypothetical protein
MKRTSSSLSGWKECTKPDATFRETMAAIAVARRARRRRRDGGGAVRAGESVAPPHARITE